MSPQNFSGHLVELPGRISPKNSVFEAIERRRVEGEEAVRSVGRQKVLATESGKKGQPAKKNKSEKKRHDRDRRINDEYRKWKSARGNSRKSPEKFWKAIQDDLWPRPGAPRLPERFLRRVKALGRRRFRDILGRPHPDRG